MGKHKQHFSSKENARTAARQALLPRPHTDDSNGWDKYVIFMRGVLPAAALIVGAITVGWPLLNETEVSFTLSQEDVKRGDDKVHMEKLQYTGTDAVDRLFKVVAASGSQENPHAPRIRLEEIRADINIAPITADYENPAFVTAKTGIYRIQDATLSLIGGVHLETFDGYVIDMAGAEVDLRARKAIGQGSVAGKSPLGILTADRLELDINDSVAIFDGSVKIRITPNRKPQK